MCFDFLYSFIWNISHSKKNWVGYNIYIYIYIYIYIGLHEKYPLFLSYFIDTNFFDIFSKNSQILSFVKFRPVVDEVFDADGRMGGQMDGLT